MSLERVDDDVRRVDWVTLEIDAARAADTTVIPILPTGVKPWGPLADQKGLTVEPRRFEQAMDDDGDIIRWPRLCLDPDDAGND